MEELHIHHVSILGYNHIAEWALQHLLLHYTKSHLPTYIAKDTPGEAISKLLTHLRDADGNERLFNSLECLQYPQSCQVLFTDDTRQNIRDDVNHKNLDIVATVNLLRNGKIFPTSMTKYRKGFQCSSSRHQYCCLDCTGQHICGICSRSSCKGMCCITGVKECNHQCKTITCLQLENNCYEKSTVCCKSCGICLYCMVASSVVVPCAHRDNRGAIKVILNVRNLSAHEIENLWIKLDKGEFDSAKEFPSCTNWQQLWDFAKEHLVSVLNFLKNHLCITVPEFDTKVYELNKLESENKGDLLKSYFEEMSRQYTKYVIDTRPQKSITISFMLDIPHLKRPRKDLTLTGKLMDVVVNKVKDVAAIGITVKREMCTLVFPRGEADIMKLVIKISHPSEATLGQYDDIEKGKARDLWDKLEIEIKDVLKCKLEIDADVFLDGWSSGSVVINMCIEGDIEVQKLGSSFLLVKESILKVVSKEIPDCCIEIDLREHLDEVTKLKISLVVQSSSEENASLMLQTDALREKCKQFAIDYLQSMSLKDEGKFVAVIGNLGVGKSTLLNCLMGKAHFMSGINIGNGLSKGANQVTVGEVTYIDTPGLKNHTKYNEDAAKAIAEALRQDGQYQIAFVVALESGRVKPEDVATIKLVLESAPEITSFGVVINKLSPKIHQALSSNDGSQRDMIVQQLTGDLGECQATTLLLPNVEDLEGVENTVIDIPMLNEYFDHTLPSIRINKNKVQEISKRDAYHPEYRQEIAAIQKQIDQENVTAEEMSKTKNAEMLQSYLSSTRSTTSPGRLKEEEKVVQMKQIEDLALQLQNALDEKVELERAWLEIEEDDIQQMEGEMRGFEEQFQKGNWQYDSESNLERGTGILSCFG